MRKTFVRATAASVFLLASLAACAVREAAAPAADGAAKPPQTEVETQVLPDRNLHCDLQAKPAYHPGERVEVTFRIANQGQTPLWVLRWNTPLEGLVGDCFEISHDDEVVFFEGRMVKRGMPEASEYVLIPPGESREGKVDLRAAYKVEAPGKYQLKFDSVLFDVADEESQVPRRLDDHQPFDPRCPDVFFEVR